MSQTEGPSPPVTPLSVDKLTAHLKGIALVICGVPEKDTIAAIADDSKDGSEGAAEKFLSEQGSTDALFLFYSGEANKWKLAGDPRNVDTTTNSVIALVKSNTDQQLDDSISVSKQTAVTVMPAGSPFDPFLRMLQSTFEPLMSASVESKPSERREKGQIMQSVEELLINLSDQSAMKIPRVDLDKYVHEAVKVKCKQFNELPPAQLTDKIAVDCQIGADKTWDGEFIAAVYRQFQQCVKDIKSVVEMENKRKTSVLANAREEVKFWIDLKDSLDDLKRQLNCKGWLVQLDILKRSSRIFIQGVTGLEHDSGLHNSMKAVKEHAALLSEFPLGQLHQAHSIDQLQNAVGTLFEYLNKHLKTQMTFPIPRIMNLVDAVTRDFNKQLLKILSTGLLDMDFEVFSTETRGCTTLFSEWTTNYRRFSESAKQAARKQPNSFVKHIPERVQMEHLPLKQRVEQVFIFRRGYQKFVQVLKEVMPSDGTGLTGLDALEEMQRAFDGVKKAIGNRLLDVTDDGQIIWERAHKAYEERVDKVEQHITNKLRDRLNAAETAIEMFRVFSKFNPLTSNRPKIRSAIQQYQATLIQKVKQDMDALKDKFTAKYENSEARNMSRIRDLPKVSSNIIWAKGIERQLQTSMKRVEDVYGRGWDRLKSMRKKGDGTQISGYWTLDEQLSEFVGVKQHDILEKKARDSLITAWSRYNESPPQAHVRELELRVIGTAIALAFLEVVFPDCQKDWQALATEGLDSLGKMEKQLRVDGTFDAIKSLLQEIGVAARHMEGSHLRREGEVFRQKIHENINRLMKTWNEQMKNHIRKDWGIFVFIDKTPDDDAGAAGRSKQRVEIQGPIFLVQQNGSSSDESLVVNFNSGIIGLIKEVDAMRWLNYMRNVDFEIAETSVAAQDVYPYAMALCESAKQFQKDIRTVDEGKSLLLTKETGAAYHQLNLGLRLKWEDELQLNKVSKYAKALHEVVMTFRRRLTTLNKKIELIDTAVDTLEKCDPTPEAFKKAFDDAQKALDDMNLDKYSNMTQWVQTLDVKIEKILATRLTDILRHWTHDFIRLGDSEETTDEDHQESSKKKKKRAHFNMSPVGVKIKIHNRVMVLDPSIDSARQEWTARLQKVLSWILYLPKLQAARYDECFGELDEGTITIPPDVTYASVLEKVDPGIVYASFGSIDKRCEDAHKYFEDWVKFQALWEMELDRIVVLCGEELSRWLSLLGDIKQSKNMTDSSETAKSFGAIVVCYQNVQEKVSKKYDETNRKLLEKFMVLLGSKMKTFYDNVHEERLELEKMDFAAQSHNMIKFLTRIPDIRKKLPSWERDIKLLGQGEKTLRKQIHANQFPQNWLWMERLKGEWDAFNAAFESRNREVESRKDKLQKYVLEEDQSCDLSFQELKKDWNEQKPVKGAKPGESINVITIFEGKATNLMDNFKMICQAKEALDMDVRDIGKMNALVEDIQALKDVWDKLDGIYTEISQMGDQKWKEINPRRISGQLRELEAKLRNFPSNMRTYTAYSDLERRIDALIKVNPTIANLCSDSIKDRHWAQIVQLVHADGFENSNILTLGKVWDCDLLKYQSAFQHVISQAQGEMALEVFLADVKKYWQELELDTVHYKKKCYLIKGWDTISDKLSEHINSLQSMKMSQYFKAFEEEGTNWEDKLSKIKKLFGVPDGFWFNVQRKWGDLEGIFTGNQDIKRQLPTQTQAFARIDTEFQQLTVKVNRNPFILGAFSIPGVTEKLEGLLKTLTSIQKALGDYLETQRKEFPRFYFVGDEDLLEIIGHSKEPTAVQKHCKKMFAGITLLDVDVSESMPKIRAMKSFENEIVQFNKPVDLAQTPAVNDWLKGIETEMHAVLQKEAAAAAQNISKLTPQINDETLTKWVMSHPSQILEVAISAEWTRLVEEQLRNNKGKAGLDSVRSKCIEILSALARMVLSAGGDPIKRKKIEHLITSLVYQRDATGRLAAKGCSSIDDFDWLVHMRFYLRNGLAIAELANAELLYSYEYLGVGERLVQTPLTDKCYLTLTQALHTKMGGAPSGPAGTGKTETVKALGVLLARFVLVFCCDEAFDFKAMGRIFVGLCQVGAWGCFDEFNRLEERILSAVSQQIQIIQEGLSIKQDTIHLLDRDVPMHRNVGIFITMNPGYAGRSELPDNLKQLFRSVSMSAPDREIIAEVMLFSQGFQEAELLAKKIVPLFQLCKDQLSPQGHYDFGLRALKSTLVNAGNMKRDEKGTQALTPEEEHYILLKSTTKTIEPKLVAADIDLFYSLTSDVFPGLTLEEAGLEKLIETLKDVCKETHLVGTTNGLWLQKVLQLYQIQNIHHGLMLVGPSCSGKTMAWSTLLIALSRMQGCEGVAHVIDPKALSKAELYGNLESTTREWTDGIFTATLRKIVDNNTEEEHKKIHWIIFDGDVDPEWVENLNALLDDNRLLTLPNGERLTLPHNVRVMFEVQDLKYATLATVSRCGMVWFSEDVCTVPMTLHHYIHSLNNKTLDNLTKPYEPLVSTKRHQASLTNNDDDVGGDLEMHRSFVKVLKPHFEAEALVHRSIKAAEELLREHTIMEWDTHQYLGGLFSLVNKGLHDIFENNTNPEFGLLPEVLEKYALRRLLMSIAWAFGGACNLIKRLEFCKILSQIAKECGLSGHVPPGEFLEYNVTVHDAEWESWDSQIQPVDIDVKKFGTSDAIVATVDTVRHEEVVLSWLLAHRPMMFCGPPGSGKTMTLTSVLRSAPDYEPVFLNFSSGSTPDMILKVFETTAFSLDKGTRILRPATPGKWIVVFCDECNLPATDTYGTQRVISLLRQLMERGGFYKPDSNGEMTWFTLERIQFAGACNPPTDAGRVPLSHRFLRWAPLLFVDFPTKPSLELIYGNFCRAFLRPIQQLKHFGDQLARAMVQFYQASQKRFTPEIEAHYVYSPRELSRWTTAVHEGIESLTYPMKQALKCNELIRLAVHEGLRLFRDRLLRDDEKAWTDDHIDESFRDHFPDMDSQVALTRPILYSTFLSKEYTTNNVEDLRSHMQGKLKVFAEEEMDVQLVVFDSVLDHILRIDRIIRQPLGHMLLVGVAGAGKTVLSKFVAWHSGMSIFQIKAHRKYTISDFEEDLRTVLKRAGCKGERICFIFDESNVMGSGFLEYMNALLASGEVPGLFEGQEEQLMQQAREGINSQPGAKVVDTSDEHQMYKWFVSQVKLNLHVIFTMNPNSPDFHNRCQTSPALFNRCTIDWFGEWSDAALEQVASEYTSQLDLMESQDAQSPAFKTIDDAQGALVSGIVKMHHHINNINTKLKRKGAGRGTFITPRHYLDFIRQFKSLYKEKREQVLDQQMHLNTGITKLHQTTAEVNKLKQELEKKEKHLQEVQQNQHRAMEQLKIDQVKTSTEQDKAAELQKRLTEETTIIEEKTATAQVQLSEAEPVLEAAKKAVGALPESALREIRVFNNPPEKVRRVMEMVVTLLGHKSKDWKSIQSLMNDGQFLKNLIAFNSNKITDRAESEVGKYLTGDFKDNQAAYRASKAAGPLYDWSTAQLMYATKLREIKPLTNIIDELRNGMVENQQKLEEIQATIAQCKESVKRMEEEFSQLTSDAEKIKLSMKDIKIKCERSEKLLKSLSSEKVRWEEEKDNFGKQITTVVGDCLLSGGFLAYNGYFDDHHRRSVILPKWMKSLKARKISFKKHLSLQEYLSKPGERLAWQAGGLPADELYVENAIILSRYQRYPLLIDPNGMAVAFLMHHYKEQNIAKTSFLEDGLQKALDKAVRFGYPLLVQDVECIDPLMNPILNKEVIKQGGRTLVRVGDQYTDLSPQFKIFLSTRDPSFQFAPDLCGRVTFANFTVTPGSLTSQCLHHILKKERPEIEEQRSEMLKTQGEYLEKQRLLEQQLLEEISKAKGNILENDALIEQLEKLKMTTTDVKEKLEKMDETMETIKKVERQFRAVSDGCSKLYFMLQQLTDLNPLYHFSLGHFIDILTEVLQDKNNILPPNEKPGKTSDTRRDMLIRQLFVTTYERVSRGMLQTDHLTLGLRLCQVRLALKGEKQVLEPELWDFLVSTGQGSKGISGSLRNVPQGLEKKQITLLNEMSNLPAMEEVRTAIESDPSQWGSLLQTHDPTEAIPRFWKDAPHPVAAAMKELLILKVFRPDSLKAAASKLIREVFDTAATKINDRVQSILRAGETPLGEISNQVCYFLIMFPFFNSNKNKQTTPTG